MLVVHFVAELAAVDHTLALVCLSRKSWRCSEMCVLIFILGNVMDRIRNEKTRAIHSARITHGDPSGRVGLVVILFDIGRR